MPHHIIAVTLLNDGRVNSVQNPEVVAPGDTVEWRFVDLAGQAVQDALIDFRGFMPAGGSSISGPQQQPFTVQLSAPSAKNSLFSVANAARGLYFYVIIRDGQVLDWVVPLFRIGSFSPFFGGIIIRDPPI